MRSLSTGPVSVRARSTHNGMWSDYYFFADLPTAWRETECFRTGDEPTPELVIEAGFVRYRWRNPDYYPRHRE